MGSTYQWPTSGQSKNAFSTRSANALPVEDGYIAATARRYGLTIATGNDRHFKRPGLKVFNPFKELP
jgi:predicted nucleic acid-binding protein